MKSFIAFVALIAVAVANPLGKVNRPVTSELSELEAIIAAISSPNTDPATAALLEEQLAAIIAETSPISVGPAIIEPHPISVGPAIIDFPLPDGGEVTAVEPAPVVVPTPVVQPSPVVVGEVPAGATPLVQIIVNVNQQESSPAVVAPAPVETPVIDEVYVPGPVNVADNVIAPEPVIIDPVQVVTPVIVEPVQVGTPIIPAPAVVLPDTLN